MKDFQQGHFDKSRVAPSAKPFCPVSAHSKIEEVSLDKLKNNGKELVLLDLDNTLTTWKSEDFDPEVIKWIEQAKALGFKLALISNSIRGERSHRVGERFGMPVFRGRFKPSRQSFQKALAHFGLPPEKAIMIGDQLITDVLGANRTGIEAIWIARRGEKEFQGTAIHRWLENRITPALYKAIIPLESLPGVEPIEETEAEVQATAPPVVAKQAMRFVIVGGTVWVINTLLATVFEKIQFGSFSPSDDLGQWMLNTLPNWLHWGTKPADESRYVLWWIAALIAMLFSFWLNRSWTFGVSGKKHRGKQLRRFYLISIIGTIFNTLLASFFKQHLGPPTTGTTILAQGFSAFIVAFWNFFGQRLYAFRE